MDFDLEKHTHRRLNALTGEWILVSPSRTARPWRGRVESVVGDIRSPYDPSCYLCPGNERAGGVRNPKYESVFVFTNDFPAISPDTPAGCLAPNPLFRSESARGTCRVVCFSPRHDLTLARMEVEDIHRVVDVWAAQTEELGRAYRWVQVFENKGEIMGCSNSHPHGQIWAGTALPTEPAKEDARQRAYAQENGSVLLRDYARMESHCRERVIIENEYWQAVAPFWGVWPFETLLQPVRHVLRLPDLLSEERESLASVLQELTARYDNLFATSFPYSMGWHGAPNDSQDYGHWQLHAHFYPPLLRSASVKKFMVGYEMLAEPQRDLTPEEAALRIREQPSRFAGS